MDDHEQLKSLLSDSDDHSNTKNAFTIDVITLSSIVQGSNKQLLNDYGGVNGVANKLMVKEGLGIFEEHTHQRRKIFGSNTFEEGSTKSLLDFFIGATQDLTLGILAICALVSITVGVATNGIKDGWYDGTAILFSIMLVITVTALSDYQQYLQFRALDKEKDKILVQVTRSSKRQRVLISELVVGDVVHLGIGDRVPADGLLLDGQSLVIDESSMTGESEPTQKSNENPFLLSGTKVQDGSGVMLVTGVGMNTEWGRVMSILSGSADVQEESTPLQRKLEKLATLIGKVGVVFAVMTFTVLVTKFIICTKHGHLLHWSGKDIIKVFDFLATAVTIIVVAVPEGLPLAVTLSLAFAMNKMFKEKALVRHLSACETMGSATCICSDKTGTLTTNQMEVTSAWIAGEVFYTTTDCSSCVREAVLQGIFQNTSGDVVYPTCSNGVYQERVIFPNGIYKQNGICQDIEVIGSPTECALLRFGLKFGGVNAVLETRQHSRVVQLEPFNSVRKRMGVLVQLINNKRYRVHWKGASEIVLGMCSKYLNRQGDEVVLDSNKREELQAVILNFANQGLRTLCLAYRDLELNECVLTLPEEGLVCVGIVGIKDPVRPGVKDAVKVCLRAGIKVRMVTGDNLYTAMTIARECGIFTNGDAVEGPEFRSWSNEELKRRIPKLQVLARTSPSDKHKLVKELQAMGEIVAVTGDGTNDAPALYEADIGISMGISGTEVAKESSDIIILDDNFASIVNVVKWGRSVYTNIQKFVQFQSTVNLVALVLNFLSACFSGEVPLSVVQLLWVNLIMDTLGALALATEAPHERLMWRPPVCSKESFVNKTMCRNVIAQAVYQLALLIILLYKGKVFFGLKEEQVLNTIIFNTFVFLQVFNEFNSREMERINVFQHLNNWIFLCIISVTVIFQVVLVQWLGKLANTTPLNAKQWLFSVGFSSLSLLVDTMVKACHRGFTKYLSSKNTGLPW